MRIKQLAANGRGKPIIHISLSRKNLIALLTKLDEQPDSLRTIDKNLPEANLIVTAEPDEEAYVDQPAGVMSPETELRMATHPPGWRGLINHIPPGGMR